MPSVCYSKSPAKTLIPVVGGFADTAAGRAQCFICSLNMTMKTEQKKINSCLIQAKCWTSFSPKEMRTTCWHQSSDSPFPGFRMDPSDGWMLRISPEFSAMLLVTVFRLWWCQTVMPVGCAVAEASYSWLPPQLLGGRWKVFNAFTILCRFSYYYWKKWKHATGCLGVLYDSEGVSFVIRLYIILLITMNTCQINRHEILIWAESNQN